MKNVFALGSSYLIKEYSSDWAYSLFAEKTKKEFKGYCITRTNPSYLREKYKILSPVLWLTNQPDKDDLKTSNLGHILQSVKKFVQKNKNSLILLDRIDYLINLYTFEQVIKFIYSLNDIVMSKNAVLLVNVNPEILNNYQLNLLQQEIKEITRKDLGVEDELEDDLHEILLFAHTSPKKVSFKDISRQFSITKTTTRKRIRALEKKGFVIIRKNGRNKIVLLTEKGKKHVPPG